MVGQKQMIVNSKMVIGLLKVNGISFKNPNFQPEFQVISCHMIRNVLTNPRVNRANNTAIQSALSTKSEIPSYNVFNKTITISKRFDENRFVQIIILKYVPTF